jgi:hypothetical protein
MKLLIMQFSPTSCHLTHYSENLLAPGNEPGISGFVAKNFDH